MPPVGFQPAISAGERPQTYALGLAATGTGIKHLYLDTNNSKACFDCMSWCVKFRKHLAPS